MTRTRTAELVHGGGMHFDGRTGTGRTIAFDDVHEAGHSPVELVVTALAACTGMDVISIALKKRQDVLGYVVRIEAEQRDEYPRVLARIDIVHEVTGEVTGVDVAAIRRCIELSAEKYCPVNAMLSAGATEIHHRYRIVRPTGDVEEGEVVVTGPERQPEVVA